MKVSILKCAISMVLVPCVLATSGCASFRQASNDMGKWTSDPLVPPMAAPVDLISLLSEGKRATEAEGSFATQFEKEVYVFNSTNADPTVSKLKRNLIQDRMKISADQLCDDYKANIMRKQARSNFWLGTASRAIASANARNLCRAE